MDPSPSPDLGPTWDARSIPGGGTDLRVAQRGRGCLVVGSALITICWIGAMGFAMIAHRAMPLGVSPGVGAAVAAISAAFAVWCALGEEHYHLAPNTLEHHVGIGRLRRIRSYRDAEVGVLVFFNKWGKPFGRLYVIDPKGRHFLLERSPKDAAAVAAFIASATGWPRRDFPPGTGF